MDSTAARSIRPFVLAWCIYLIFVELIGFTSTHIHAADFRCFYAAGYLVRTHPSQLYDLAQQQRVQSALVSPESGVMPFYHLPYETLMYVPFSMLKYRTAYLAFIAFDLFLLMAAFFVARPAFSATITLWQPRPGLIFFIFIPVLSAAIHGEDSFLTLLLYCATWRQLISGREMSAGSFLALAMYKPHLVIPIAILTAIRSGWRFATGFLATSVGVGLLGIAIVGRAATVSLIKLLSGAASATQEGAIAHQLMSVYPPRMPNLAGVIYACGARSLSSASLNVLIAIGSLCIFGWCIILVRRCTPSVAFAVAILCGMLISYHFYIYDLTPALLPAVLLEGRAHRYILLFFFVAPVVLLQIGLDWLFLLALPLGAMLAYASVSACKITAPPETALATPT